MNYFKRIETAIIATIILVLAVAYGMLHDNSTTNRVVGDAQTNSNQTEIKDLPSQSLGGYLVKHAGVEGKTAMEILKGRHNVETQSFGDSGEFVKSIDGILPSASQFWSFYVNGEQAQVGADKYITKSSDQIEWKLEEIQ